MNDAVQPPSDVDATRARYTLTSDAAPDAFVVVDFELTEKLSRPYRLRASIMAEHETTDLRALLGRDVTFTIERGGLLRFVQGIVSSVRYDGRARDRQRGTVVIVPALADLARQRTSRIFQGQSAVEIVESLLSVELARYDRDLDASSLDRSRYLTRDYCVQYQESTLDFVHRLLEEEGVGYYFAEGEEHERLVLFDDNRSLERLATVDDAPVPFDPMVRARADAEPVMRFAAASALVAQTLTLHDHDYARGRSTRRQTSDEGAPPEGVPHEVYQHGHAQHITIHEDAAAMVGLVAPAVAAAVALNVAEPSEWEPTNLPGALMDGYTSDDLEHQVSMRRELLHRDARTFRGLGVVTGFTPGRSFELMDDPVALGAASPDRYLLTEVTHRSRVSDVAASCGEGLDLESPDLESLDLEGANYVNHFTCQPLGVAWRPARTTEKPRVYGVQTATVTGPAGMDVFTDGSGRIKVRFPWDRAEAQPSGEYTCWLRVSQTWAGAGAPGFMFIPRVGMEVVVAFVDGDPDRPLVTGCVYDAQHPTPGLLPLQATKSIIRTRTVPHGPGYNELSFEDAMGMERVHIRAERDLDEQVNRHHVTHVGESQRNIVGHDHTEEVGRNRSLVVRGGSQVHVTGPSLEHFGERTVSVGGSEQVQVEGGYRLTCGGPGQLDSSGGELVLKGKDAVALIQGGRRFIEINGDADEEPGIWLDSKGATIHVAEDQIELRVGSSTITITEAGIRVNQKSFPAAE